MSGVSALHGYLMLASRLVLVRLSPPRNPLGVHGFGLQSHQQPEGLRIAFKTPALCCPLRERLLTVVTKGWVAKVMGQTGRFHNIGIKTQPIRKFPHNLGHFKRVGEAVSRKIQARRGREDLGFCR